jgi:hypothetical protein
VSIPLLTRVALSPTIQQPVEYHDFADQRQFVGNRHFWNVVSNLPFAVIGLAGCVWLLRQRRTAALARTGSMPRTSSSSSRIC